MADNFFSQLIQSLAAAGIESPRLEARILMAYVLGVENNALWSETKLDSTQQNQVNILLNRRLNHEPLDKILGHKDFYKYRFLTDSRVLSPRPDSEVLVEAAVEIIKRENLHSVLEFGVGSGCLLLSILADIENIYGVGADVSKDALCVATENAAELGVSNRVRLIEFDYFHDDIEESFDLLISNPPYIPSGDIDGLDIEVKKHDPMLALDGGDDGLNHYRQIAKLAPRLLNLGGYVVLEVGINQADDVSQIFSAHGLKPMEIRCDLGGIKRCVILKK